MSFEVGDRVWDVLLGDGVVEEIDENGIVIVGFENRVHYGCPDGSFEAYHAIYRNDGKDSETDMQQRLFFAGTKIIPAPEPSRCPYKKDDLVLVRDNDDEPWQCHRFLYYDKETSFPYKVIGVCFNQCIPFVGNEHLLDTSNSPDE